MKKEYVLTDTDKAVLEQIEQDINGMFRGIVQLCMERAYIQGRLDMREEQS